MITLSPGATSAFSASATALVAPVVPMTWSWATPCRSATLAVTKRFPSAKTLW